MPPSPPPTHTHCLEANLVASMVTWLCPLLCHPTSQAPDVLKQKAGMVMVGTRHSVTKSLSLPSLTCSVQGLRHAFLIREEEGDFGSPDKQEKEFACIHYKMWPVTTLTLVGGGMKTVTRPQRHQDS